MGSSSSSSRSDIDQPRARASKAEEGSMASTSDCIMGSSSSSDLIVTEGGEDRISSLPDDILVSIIEKLDLRSRMQCTTISIRWMHLPCMVTCIRLDVKDFLPRIKELQLAHFNSAMVVYADTARRLLAPRIDRAVWSVQLRLFLTDDHVIRSIAHVLSDTVQGGNIKFLEFMLITMCPSECTDEVFVMYGQRFMSFFTVCPDAFKWLKKLTIQYLRLGESDIPNLLNHCTQLRYLIMQCCDSGPESVLNIDAPDSQLRKLHFEECSYKQIELTRVPQLLQVICNYWLGDNPPVVFGDVPCIYHISVSTNATVSQLPFKLSTWLSNTRSLTVLDVDFCDYMVWIEPEGPKELYPIFNNLRDIHLLDIFAECDLSWTLYLLEGAPNLRNFFIRVSRHICVRNYRDDNAERTNVLWESSDFNHYNLNLLDISGFEVEDKLMKYIRLVLKHAPCLETVCLHKNKPCDAYDAMHTQAPSVSSFPVDEDSKNLIREQLLDGFSSSVEITFR